MDASGRETFPAQRLTPGRDRKVRAPLDVLHNGGTSSHQGPTGGLTHETSRGFVGAGVAGCGGGSTKSKSSGSASTGSSPPAQTAGTTSGNPSNTQTAGRSKYRY